MIVMNLKQEIGTLKASIKKIERQIPNCKNEELKQHLEYQLKQEQIKLEGYELLLSLAQKVGNYYE